MKLLTRLKYSWLRFRHRKELFDITFESGVPSIGDVITMGDGTEVLVVSEPYKVDGRPTMTCYIVKAGPQLPDIEIDYLKDLPEDAPVIFGRTMWVRKGKQFECQWVGEQYQA